MSFNESHINLCNKFDKFTNPKNKENMATYKARIMSCLEKNSLIGSGLIKKYNGMAFTLSLKSKIKKEIINSDDATWFNSQISALDQGRTLHFYIDNCSDPRIFEFVEAIENIISKYVSD